MISARFSNDWKPSSVWPGRAPVSATIGETTVAAVATDTIAGVVMTGRTKRTIAGTTTAGDTTTAGRTPSVGETTTVGRTAIAGGRAATIAAAATSKRSASSTPS